MFPMAAQVGFPGLEVMDRMSFHVLEEEQLALSESVEFVCRFMFWTRSSLRHSEAIEANR